PIENINQQIDQHYEEGKHKYQGLNGGIIPVRDGVDKIPANAWNGEHRLDHHDAAKQDEEFDANNGDHREQGVSERVLQHHHAFEQSLGAGRAHVVIPQDFEDAGASHAGANGGEAIAGDQRWENQLLKIQPGIDPERLIVQ